MRLQSEERTANGTVTYRLTVLAVSAILCFLALCGVVSAIQTPLPGNACYKKQGGEFIAITCPASIELLTDQCVLITELPGGSTSNQYNQLDCLTGNMGATVERVEPDDSSVVTNIGSRSGENEPDRVLESDCVAENGTQLTAETDCKIVDYLVAGINFLSAVALLSIIASVVMAGYQYMTAKDNSGQVEAARKRITWAIIALGIFLFMYTILNFIVPGGVL